MSDFSDIRKALNKWRRSDITLEESDFTDAYDGDKELEATGFYGGYLSREDEIIFLRREIERKDEAMKKVIDAWFNANTTFARACQITIDLLEEALSTEEASDD